ncbi:NAD-dependent epimerase/dehydratase family protein [Euryhalocaulis caribicus]|uniref:NAD-dependent epimerase/dehydratase family protein n=1 Tax=Euryhalocaulis caribicus TaxID=1161401 RepID=UPI0003B7B005|nr:NAD-dependent epimerase/dehydratase family protein [Euryhalocaulis caribicus]
MEENRKDIVIVTGSSGYIGSEVVKRLAGDYQVIGFDRDTPPHPPAEAECVCFDITDETSIEAAFQRVRTAYGDRIASVIHLASYFDLTGEPNPKYDAVTVKGTESLLAALQDFQVEQFVFASTMLVHAPTRPGCPINEGAPMDDELPYRESKIKTEKLIREQRGDIPAVFLRPAGLYDGQGHSAFLAQQIARIYEKRTSSRVYPGDLSAGQPYLHIDDLLDAIMAVIQRRASLPPELPVLLGEDDVMTYGEVQKSLGRLIHDEDWKTQTLPKAAAKAGAWAEHEIFDEDAFIRPWMVEISDHHYELDLSAAQENLDWRPKRSLRKKLPEIIANLKSDPFAWYRENGLNASRVAEDKVETATQQAETASKTSDMKQHNEDMRRMHFNMLWVHWLTMGLGLWLATVPFVFGLFNQTEFSAAVLRVTAERDLWEPATRSVLTGWNNVIAGVLIMFFAGLSLKPGNGWAQWANTCIGIWLLGAPLLFWTPHAAVYANDTFVGALIIALTILIPMMPGMAPEGMMDDTDVPPGWSYSPSTYLQRLPIIALGAVGFTLSRILTAYQLGHVETVWEPFFDVPGPLNGSEDIITSEVSKAWPVADGGIGAMSYMFEILMGAMGGRARWRTMPWMVTLFGIVVVPLGVISIYFIIIQPIVIGTYCTVCLMAALAMLIMIPYSLDELVAMGQFLVWNTKRGRPFWRVFFRGDALPGSGKDRLPGFESGFRSSFASALRGVSLSWPLLISAFLGGWVMISRLVFDVQSPLADSDHLVGALVMTVAIIAMAEVARPVRFLNIVFGVWLVAAPWMLEGGAIPVSINDVVSGLALIALSLPRGARSNEHYGGWDRFIV